jgi:UDP-N-acetylglucosamine--N-acetylmuramyl-(pentapeptide) pyrophosphoryl-undecaprenol N-acetylglucosamine transferase
VRVLFAGGGTGGHLYPGLAIARALVRLDPRAEPFFVGAMRGIERDVLPGSGFPHALLDLHPLYRAKPWLNARTVAGLAGAWRTLGRLARERRPALLVATGGYASGAAIAHAAAHGVPIVLQEQNSFPGLTTRAASRVAREIHLGYGEAARWLHPRRGAWVGTTGNPIEPPPEPRPDRAAARRRWGFPGHGGRVLLVFGGSQGARAVNEVVAAWVRRGVAEGLHLIWATGKGSHAAYAALDSERVRVVPYLSPIAEAYAAADLALARAGALTAAELCAWGIPAVLVPLPTAAADHQTGNARALAEAGAAVMLPQRELSVERLDAELARLLGDPAALEALARAALARGRPHAAEEIAKRILALIGATGPDAY